MVIGVGVDVVSIRRVASVYKKHGVRFLNRFFPECSTPRNVLQLAGWFAVKEAVIKASGGRVGWKGIKIGYGKNGAPKVFVDGLPGRFRVSISHDGDYAAAVALWEV